MLSREEADLLFKEFKKRDKFIEDLVMNLEKIIIDLRETNETQAKQIADLQDSVGDLYLTGTESKDKPRRK